jgi:hypothetical protein
MSGQQQTQRQSGPPLKLGVVFGGAAFVVGYALTYGLLVADGALEGVEDSFQYAGWVFFDAQFVEADVGGPATVDTLSFLSRSDALSFPALTFTVLIGLVILAAGYFLTSSYMVPGTTTDEGTVYGASIAVGYLPFAFLGALLFEVEWAASAFTEASSGTPDIFGAVLLAGIVFPALLGAVGGYLAVRRAGNAADAGAPAGGTSPPQ